MKHWKHGVLLVGIIAGLVAPSVFAGTPTGSGPTDPLMVTGDWQTIAPETGLWFSFDYGGDKSRVQVSLDAYGASNVRLAIFTPAQATAWLQDPSTSPIGFGTPPGANSAAAIHDLVWQGAFNFAGRFFAVVTNHNATPIPFRLTVMGAAVTLAPTPTPTALPVSPFATPIPIATLQGRLVFQESSGGNTYTVNGDGSSLKRISYGLNPSWSPDGKRVAFSRWNEPAGLFVMNADGSDEQRLFGAPRLLSPQWSPDGTRIAFARQRGGSTDDSQFCFGRACFSIPADPHWKLGVVDATSGTLTEPQCSNHCFSPTWSSDNYSIAYADAAVGIMVANANGGPAATIFSQNSQVQSPAWSPDGTSIAFMFRQHDHWEIGVIKADGSGMQALTRPDPLAFGVVNSVAPTWSPDGKQILFLSDRGGKWEFFVVNPDGSNLHQVLKGITDSIPIRYNFSNERVIDWTK